MVKKRSLSVGINDYPLGPLRGCVNDALHWTGLLKSQGYDARTLLNVSATKAAILTNIREMVEDSRFGDRIVITLSGHGTQVPDRDGDEDDAWDEAICAVDYTQGGLITDDELYEVISRKRFGVRVTIFADLCYSGTLTRFVDQGMSQPRFLPAQAFMDLQPRTLERLEADDGPVTKPRRLTSKAVLFSGCDEEEVSWDAWIDGLPQGAFSYYALRSLREAPGSTYGAWQKMIRYYLPAQFEQTPQLVASLWQRTWRL